MKRIWRRVLSMLLAAQMLVTSMGYAMAAETAGADSDTAVAAAAVVPYDYILYNINYASYAGESAIRRLLVEGKNDVGREADYLPWETERSSYTLQTLAQDTTFPLYPSGRVPDRTFAGWTVFTGVKAGQGSFADLGAAELLDDSAEIRKDVLDAVINRDPNDINGESWADDELPLVGRWKLSDEAYVLPTTPLAGGDAPAATAFSAATQESGCDKLYGKDISGLSVEELANTKTEPLAKDTYEYWLRVTTETDKLNLSVIAPEPYVYDGATQSELAELDALPEAQKPGVHITVTATDGTITTLGPSDLEYTVLNDSTWYEMGAEWTDKKNTAACPARSRWTAAELALTQSGGSGKYYNDITVTVVSPNGKTTAEYVFHVQRLAEPTLISKPGNTPFGMFERDSKLKDKAAAKTEFASTRRFNNSHRPSGPENNNGAIYYSADPKLGGYTANAWAGAMKVDPDLDQTAIVVYQNSAVTVPGFEVADSAGNIVGGTSYQDTMQYSLKLRLVDKLTWGASMGEQGLDNYYDGSSLTTSVITPPAVTEVSGEITINLRDERVAPGIYTLEYIFKDPVSGREYSSDPDSFDSNKANAAGFARAFIVLPIPGDADMNGTVTMADALTMETMLKEGSGFLSAVASGDPVACLVAYRVCDIDGNGVFSQGDADAIWGGYKPQVKESVGTSNYFYLPLNSDSVLRSGPAAVTGGKPLLTLDYLGATPVGLSDSELDNKLQSGSVLSATADYGEGLQLGDVFWVGIRLTLPEDYIPAAGSALKMGITAAAMSVVYDSTLVEPATLNGLSWEDTLRKYNARLDSAGVSTNYMWSTDYNMVDGSERSGDYGPRFDPISGAKAISPLETTAGSEKIRELRVAIRQYSDVRRTIYSEKGNDVILLRVPFEVIAHPHNQSEINALGLSLGPRELAFAGLESAKETLLSTFWDNSGAAIFGGSSGNLAQELEYGGGTALAIKLGEDKTEYTVLKNTINGGETVYGEEFSALTNTSGMPAEEQKNLPKGLSYVAIGADAGYVKGIPEETGTFTFYVGGAPYKLTVDKAVLDLTVSAERAYYGENMPPLTFTYNKDQIKALDKSGGGNHQNGFDCTGAGSELSALGAYVSMPAIRTATALAGGTTVAAGTPVGHYYITLAGGENRNYAYRYVKNGYGSEAAFEGGYSKLEILPRPIVVGGLLKDENNPIETILFDSVTTQFQKSASYLAGEFSVRRGNKTGDKYNGLPLSGSGVYESDELTINYQADYIKNAGDKAQFVLKEAREPRDMAISRLTLASSAAYNSNYILVDPYLDTPTAKNAGIVIDRPASKVEIVKGVGLEYGNGAGLNLAGMVIRITYGSAPNTNELTLSYESRDSFLGKGVQVTWENTVDGVAPTPGHSVMEDDSHKLFALSASEHSGKYICVWVPTSTVGGGGRNYVMAAIQEPLHVAKTKLTLTLNRTGRYYGEDNPEVTYTYDPKKLSQAEYDAVKAGLGAEPKGLGSELRHLPGYVAPKINVQVGLENKTEVDRKTQARSEFYLSMISGGGSSNIDFDFARMGVGANADFGYAYFDVYPRPIVVNEVVMANGNTDSDCFLYDDTNLIQLVTMTYGTEKRKPIATTAGTDKDGVLVDQFSTALPANADGTYFPAGGSNEAKKLAYSLTGDAVANSDVLSLTYQANYYPDPGHEKAPYFSVTKGTERREADIRNMALTGEKATNYVLVYDTNKNAIDGIPTAPKADGTVKLRAMESVEINLGANFRTAYTYGSQLSLDKMSLKIKFETAGDNDPVGNQSVQVQNVSYRPLVVGGVITGDTFSILGLSVSWAPSEEELAKLTAEGKTIVDWFKDWPAANGSYPTVLSHSGRQLAVYGRRYAGTESDVGHPIVFAQTKIAAGVKVTKKTLPLAVTAQNRYYGEPNPTYAFTFQATDLAKPDSDTLGAQGLSLSGTADVVGTPAASPALTKLGGYTGPVFATGAVPTTNVGTYPLTLSGGAMDNYTFSYTPATIRIFRRPIIVDAITKNPVYKIFRDNQATGFQTSADAVNFTSRLPGNAYANQKDPSYVSVMGNKTLPLTDKAVLTSDVNARAVSLNFTVNFPPVSDRNNLDGSTEVDQQVKITGLSLANGTGNYMLVYNNAGYENIGRPLTDMANAKLDLRNIEKIEIASVPKSVYTYSEQLDLSNLQVKITYQKGSGESSNQVEIVRADSRDGIYINYYNSDKIPAESEWGAVTTKYRPAANGDHLTIAPDHNTTFANFGQADKKYLIVSAIAHSELGFVQPVVVPAGDAAGVPAPGYYQIKVNPLELTYTLSASDKTYDGDTKAVGGLTLTNAYNHNGITDVVYAVTGASYEKTSADYKDYAEFLAHVASWGYLFSSGTYDRDSGKLTYTGGQYGDGVNKLTYAFVDPNVNYQDARDNELKTAASESWDSYGALATRVVEVRGIKLGGADAANYHINERVLTDTVQIPGRNAAPDATVQKAYRSAPLPAPKLEVDIHTNAVRVSMEKAADAYNPQFADAFAAELHYEYRLEGWNATDVVTPGAALQTPENGMYQDEKFFGGEPIEIPLPEGYEPSKEPEPPREGETVKGQIYRWAEEDALFGLDAEGKALREALKRDQLFRAQVRLAETHNFLSSDATPSAKDDELTASAETAREAARAAADALVERAEGSMQHDKENLETYPDPAPMVKTYNQRLVVASPTEEQGKDNERYTVVTLESVWFTDVLEYKRKEVLNSVTENFDPTRYYRFFWDVDKSGEVKFENDAPLNLGEELEVEIREKQPDGGTEEKTITANPAEPLLGGHSAIFYVTTQAEGGSVAVRTVEVTPASIRAKVGDAPVQLEATCKPAYATNKRLKWSSSDEKIATVTEKGLVSFVTSGTATITARAAGGASATVEVTVTDGTKQQIQGMLNLGYEKPFLTMTPTKEFLPEQTMTRGELVIMLARLYADNPDWTGKGSGSFPDVAGDEGYAEAAKLLGEKGIITGVSGGLFAAQGTATRAEMAVIITRMLGLEIKDTKGQPHAFIDAGEKDSWAYAYIDALAEYGIINGTGNGKFNPNGVLTRAEAACMLSRILDGTVDTTRTDLLMPTDVPTEHWGYSEILRAVNGLPEVQVPEKK